MITNKQILKCGWEKIRKHCYCIITPIGTKPFDNDWYLEQKNDGYWQIDDGGDVEYFVGQIDSEEKLIELMNKFQIKTNL